jgi:pyridoxal biosynthesis lyase PdxS
MRPYDSGYGQGAHGHFVEAQILQAIENDYIEESECALNPPALMSIITLTKRNST